MAPREMVGGRGSVGSGMVTGIGLEAVCARENAGLAARGMAQAAARIRRAGEKVQAAAAELADVAVHVREAAWEARGMREETQAVLATAEAMSAREGEVEQEEKAGVLLKR